MEDPFNIRGTILRRLDQNAIVQILNSQSWSDLEWNENDDEAAVESAQNVRGFHTLEFLLYKNGEPRKVQ